MANYVTIEAEARARAGKGAARATRRAGKVPAVIYGAHQAPDLIALDPRIVVREIHQAGWRSRLYEVKVNGTSTRALIRDVQLHPVTDRPEHVDFQRLAPGEAIRVAVAVHFQNEGISPGLKRGGVLNVVRHTVDCLVDPDHVPSQFEADLATLDINDNIRWSDLKGTEGMASAQSRMVAKLQQDPNIGYIVTLGAPFAPTALSAVQMAGSNTKVGTFDLTPQAVGLIKQGKLQWAIDQQPFAEGYEAIDLLWLYKTNANVLGGGGPVLTGPAFVTKENVDVVAKFAKQGTR